jgi:hypothetical protein
MLTRAGVFCKNTPAAGYIFSFARRKRRGRRPAVYSKLALSFARPVSAVVDTYP